MSESASTAIVPAGNRTIIIRSMGDAERAALAMSRSQYFQDAASEAKALVKILAGLEMGFGPFASMTGVHIIQGKPAPGANLMAAAVKSSGKYDYRIIKLDEQVCEIAFFEGSQEIGRSKFTIQDAQKAGTQNLSKFPRNMLFARAMSNGVKWYCPDVFNGAPVHTPEELGATVNEEGEIIDAPGWSEPAAASPAPAAQAETAQPKPAAKNSEQVRRQQAASAPAPAATRDDGERAPQAWLDKYSALWHEAKKYGIEAMAVSPGITVGEIKELAGTLKALIEEAKKDHGPVAEADDEPPL